LHNAAKCDNRNLRRIDDRKRHLDAEIADLMRQLSVRQDMCVQALPSISSGITGTALDEVSLREPLWLKSTPRPRPQTTTTLGVTWTKIEKLRRSCESAVNSYASGQKKYREASEATRESQERERMLDERQRQLSEELRETAEQLRGLAEGIRYDAEKARTAAEEARTIAEVARATQEGLRDLLREVLSKLQHINSQVS